MLKSLKLQTGGRAPEGCESYPSEADTTVLVMARGSPCTTEQDKRVHKVSEDGDESEDPDQE